jgi:hypothetical protein
MNKIFTLKLLNILSLGAVFALTACGGGGGDPGMPLVPPTAKLTMTPNISALALTVGEYSQPVKISGGQKPYYIGQMGNGVIASLQDDGTLYLLAVEPTSNVDSDGNCTSSSSSSDSGSGAGGNDNVWIQDSSYPQTTLNFTICVKPSPPSLPPLFSSLGTGSNLKITLKPGENLTFTVYGGTAPYTVYSSNTSVVKISGSATGGVLGTSNNGVIAIVAGQSITDTATIAVSDSHGASYMFTVKLSP